MGVGSLLKKYTALLCTHIGDILPVASSIASTSWRHFAEVACIVEGDFTGTFLVSFLWMCIYFWRLMRVKIYHFLINLHACTSSVF